MRHQIDGLLDLVHVALELGLVAGVREIFRLGIDALGELDVLRNVDDDGTGTAARGNMERLVQNARQILDALDQIIVFRARPRDADRVAFLEGVIADQVRWDLAGDADDRNESQSASVRPVTALVAPGPEVTSTQPTLPVERA